MKKLLTLLLLTSFFSVCAQQSAGGFNRFTGKIIAIDDDSFKFDGELLIVYNTEKRFKQVFESGLISPEIIRNVAGLGPAKKESDLPNAITHYLTITDFQILFTESKSGKIRKFRFLLHQNNGANPVQYVGELWNGNANFKTDILKFIWGAKLASLNRS